MNKMRSSAALALTLVATAGCSFSAKVGGGSSSPDPERHASNRPTRPHHSTPRRPKPEPVANDPKPDPTPNRKPEREPASSTKPEPRPSTKPSESKPDEPKPFEPKHVEPKPNTKPSGVAGFVFGKPDGLKPGLPDGFWVYQDATGWHVRSTAVSKPPLALFTARISIDNGKFSDVREFKFENNDAFKSSAQRIILNLETQGHWDGIDFTPPADECVMFDVLLDGTPQPKLIFLGANKVNPPAAVFTLCPASPNSFSKAR